MREFLEKILPDDGYYCLAIRRKNQDGGYYFLHKAFTDLDYMCYQASQLAHKDDVFFAMGSLKVPKDEENKTRRNQANIKELKCLWLDLDCGKSKGYKNQIEAIKDLKAFVADVGFPKPTVVNSGNGIHCYWTFKKSLNADDWLKVAKRFKIVTESWGIKADHACTADSSRVLRVAGTFNHKNGDKKEVKVLFYGEDSSLADIVMPIKRYLTDHPEVNLKEHSSTPDYLKRLGHNTQERKDYSLKLIIDNCPQMRAIYDEGGPAGYQRRASYISIAKLCHDADYDVLLKNDPNPDLVAKQTESLLGSSITDHPHTCERFEDNYRGGCDSCKFQGLVKSPIRLEAYLKEPIKQSEYDAMPPEEQVKVGTVVPDNYRLPKVMPEGYYYKWIGDKNWLCTKIESENDSIDANEIKIFDGIIEPVEILRFERDNEHSVKVRIIHGKDGEQFAIIKSSMFADQKTCVKALAAYGVIINFHAHRHLVNYMISFINILKNAKTTTSEIVQLGWTNDHKAFVIPEAIISETEKNERVVLSESVKGNLGYYGRAGSLEKWKQIINTYACPGYEGYAFAHLTGYGSILLEMTQMRGGIVALQGNSGAGKSTALMTINSIFGRPDSYITKQDTQVSKFARIGFNKNICTTFDEISNIEPEDLSELAYAITQGRAKDRSNQDGSLKHNNSKWAQIMACTTNHSLIHKLSNFKSDASAEAFRIFEYSIHTHDHKISRIEANRIFLELESNYGWAGEIFVTYLVKNYDKIKKRLMAWQEDFDKRMNIANNERYWSAIVSCNMVGGEIAKELGLHEFNLDRILVFVQQQIQKMRGILTDNVKEPRQVLSDFITSHVGYTLVIGKNGDILPRDKIYLRYVEEDARLFIDKSYMRKYVTNNGGDWNEILTALKDDGMVVSENLRIVMTKGTRLPAAGQTNTIVFNTEHPAMAGVRLEIVKEKAA